MKQAPKFDSFEFPVFEVITPHTNYHLKVRSLTVAQEEMLKISADGFWVHGVKVEQGPEEAAQVYAALKAFLKSTGFLVD